MRKLFAALMILMSGVGCHTYGYQPGYYGYGYPGAQTYPAQSFPVSPGGTYVPGGLPPGSSFSPTPLSPTPLNSLPSTNPTPFNSPEPTWSNDPNTGGSGTNAPPFNANPGDRPVPNPESNDFGITPGSTQRPTGDGLVTPFNSTALPGGGGTNAVTASASGIPAGTPNPYAYDVAGYRWLRGVVEFDRQASRWYLMYSIQPDPRDRFGGVLPLADHADLAVLQNDDVVLVDGQIEPATVDAVGKPMYRVTRLQLLRPKSP